MILTWKHKGLKKFFDTGVKSGINPKHATRLKIILQLLNSAIDAKDLDLPGMGLHLLKGKYKGMHAVYVSGNWRVIFKFKDKDVIEVDYLDYH